MFVTDNYIINHKTGTIIGEYTCNGMLCSRVLEGNEFFIVKKPPKMLLENTLLLRGSNLKGAMDSAKTFIGNKSMRPFIADPIHMICFFPDISPHRPNCIFFNPNQIQQTHSHKRKTIIEFKSGFIMKSELSRAAFNNKLELARQLINVFSESANTLPSIHSEPKKLLEIIKEEDGLGYRIKPVNDEDEI